MTTITAQVNSINMFKNRLDKFGEYQDIIYDFNVQSQVTGNRSGT